MPWRPLTRGTRGASRWVSAWLAFVAGLAGAHAAAPDPAAWLALARAPQLQPERAVVVRDAEIVLGAGRLLVERGILVPAGPPDGPPLELVLIGQARFRIDPPDEIEAGQAELFTGERRIDVAVDEAVLVLGAAAAQSLLDHPYRGQALAGSLDRASQLHERWLAGPERRTAGVDVLLFRIQADDAPFQESFALWCHSFEIGSFVYAFDPEDPEPVTLASYAEPNVRGWERRRLEYQLRVQQRKGRWLGVRLGDLGRWDVWMSSPPPSKGRDAEPVSAPGPEPAGGFARSERGFEGDFETRAYELEATILRDRMRLLGEARLSIEVRASGRRTLSLDLFRDLQVDSVREGEGDELFFFRSGDQVVVLLDEPSRAGRTMSLQVRWSGRVLQWAGAGTWDLLETSDWYPHCGLADRATYDVTLRWPEKYTLVAGGRRVDGGTDGSNRWERRRIEAPAVAFSFVVGSLVEERRRAGGLEIRLALHRGAGPRLTERVRDDLVETVADAVEFFDRVFGPCPVDELTVATVPRHFSQSYLGFVVLTDSLVLPPAASERAHQLRRIQVAHEVAHQWWGNAVGWAGYRDLWLSEALASYSALRFEQEASGEDLLPVMSAGWRATLGGRTAEGRAIESLGPVVLGPRLNSTLAQDAYHAIVYQKGALVLGMLARAMGEQRFLDVLREVATERPSVPLTTESFLERVARAAQLDLSGFAQRFVYGTGLPAIYYEWEAVEGEDGWMIRGAARVENAPDWRWTLARNGERWSLDRTPRPTAPPGPAVLAVPYRLVSALGEKTRLEEGRLSLREERQTFEIPCAGRPVALTLDPRGELLAVFDSMRQHPKRVLHVEAAALARSGDRAGAEARYRQALAAPARAGLEAGAASPIAFAGPGTNRDAETDAVVHLGLARLYTDERRLAEAAAEIDAAEGLLGRLRSQPLELERDVLRSLLDLERHDYVAIHERLRPALQALAQRDEGRSWRERLRKLRLRAERAALAEAWALLAVASWETGQIEDLRWAAAQARARGVDLSALPEPPHETPSGS